MDVHYVVADMQASVPRVAREAHDHHHQHNQHQSTGDHSAVKAEDSVDEHQHRHDHSMLMTFHFGSTETILFEFWKIDGVLGLLVSCLFVFVIAFLYEGLKFYRGRLSNCHRRRLEGGSNHSRTPPTTSDIGRRKSPSIISQLLVPQIGIPIPGTPMAPTDEHPQPKRRKLPWLAGAHIFQTFLHMVQVTISFMLMLIFMTCNVWLCIAVVLGAGLGYFAFFVRFENVTDHCN